jgi:hypothetical protein
MRWAGRLVDLLSFYINKPRRLAIYDAVGRRYNQVFTM